MTNQLRLGFLISDTNELPAWEFELIEQLIRTDFCQTIVFIYTPQKTPAKSSFVYSLFQKFENKWFHSVPDVLRTVNIPKQFNNAEFAYANSIMSPDEYKLDVVYVSCFVSYDKNVMVSARYGIWSISFGADNYKNASPPAFWEVMRNKTTTKALLHIDFPDKDSTITIYTNTATIPYSVKKTLCSIVWKSSSFLFSRLRELFLLEEDHFFNKYKKSPAEYQSINEAKELTNPGNFKMLGLFFKNSFGYLQYKIKGKFRNNRFSILYSNQSFQGNKIDLHLFKSLPLPAGVFWADPFVLAKSGHNYIFFEEFRLNADIGHISVIEIDKDNNWSKPVKVLSKTYHLSYPYVFEWEGDYYMIPETSSNRTVELYKATNFPYEWDFLMNLMENIVLADATLFYENNKWWLFGAIQIYPFTSFNDHLVLYYSDHLLSNNWNPHPQNPIVTDVSNCRPAGKIFKLNNNLYRPAQNNASQQYGYALKINVIEVINETEYREKEILHLLPEKGNYLSAIHTFNFENNLIVIDGIIRKKNPVRLLLSFFSKKSH